MRRANRTPLRGSVTQNRAVRLKSQDMTAPGIMLRLGALLGSVAIILTLVGWLWHIGWPQRQADRLATWGLTLTQKMHFSVRTVMVDGRRYTDSDKIKELLAIKTGDAIFSFDAARAKDEIAKLNWVADVTVERRLPDTILVRLTERKPMARWQNQGKFAVIDAMGKPLPDVKADDFKDLPLVVGSDAPRHTAELLDNLKQFPIISDKMTAATRVGERRWDLYFQPKIIAKLPEKDVPEALQQLADLIRDKKVLERDISAVDLRLPDRLVIEQNGAPQPRSGGDTRL